MKKKFLGVFILAAFLSILLLTVYGCNINVSLSTNFLPNSIDCSVNTVVTTVGGGKINYNKKNLSYG